MTAAPNSPLVEKVARAIVEVRRGYNGGDGLLTDERWAEMRDWYLKFKDDPNALSAHCSLPAFGYEAAQAALVACDLPSIQRQLTGIADILAHLHDYLVCHPRDDGKYPERSVYTAAVKLRELIARLEAKP